MIEAYSTIMPRKIKQLQRSRRLLFRRRSGSLMSHGGSFPRYRFEWMPRLPGRHLRG